VCQENSFSGINVPKGRGVRPAGGGAARVGLAGEAVQEIVAVGVEGVGDLVVDGGNIAGRRIAVILFLQGGCGVNGIRNRIGEPGGKGIIGIRGRVLAVGHVEAADLAGGLVQGIAGVFDEIVHPVDLVQQPGTRVI